jgi:hypothetical protein
MTPRSAGLYRCMFLVNWAIDMKQRNISFLQSQRPTSDQPGQSRHLRDCFRARKKLAVPGLLEKR